MYLDALHHVYIYLTSTLAHFFVEYEADPKSDYRINPWIQHVKAVQREQGLSYKEALTVASRTYRKQAGGAPAGNPLQSVINGINFFRCPEEDEDCIRNNEALDTIIEDILDFADFEEGNLRIVAGMDTDGLVDGIDGLIDPQGVKSDLRILMNKLAWAN